MANDKDTRLSTAEVKIRIAEAIVSHRLLPRTKLGEEKLAAALNTTRARIRDALARLEVEHMVVSEPNRGMFVAAPSISESRQILDARRLIEAETSRLLASKISAKDTRELRRCIERERKAWEDGDRHKAISISREFHYLIAELSGNSVLADLLRQVVARMSLAIALYDRPRQPDCFFDEHVELVDALELGDAEKAVACMVHHVNHLAHSLDTYADDRSEPDLHEVFSEL